MNTLKRRLNRLEDQSGGQRIPILLRKLVGSSGEDGSYVRATTPAGTILREDGERESAFLVRVYRTNGLSRGLREMPDDELELFMAAYNEEIALAHATGGEVPEEMLEDVLDGVSGRAGEAP